MQNDAYNTCVVVFALSLNPSCAAGTICQEDWEYLLTWVPVNEPVNSYKVTYNGRRAEKELGEGSHVVLGT
jgi:hypothetical protein